MSWLKSHSIRGVEGTLVFIYAQPGASRTQIRGLYGEPPRLKVALQSKPIDGAANRALIDFFSQLMEVPLSQVHLLSGETSKQKSLWIQGCHPDDFTKIID